MVSALIRDRMAALLSIIVISALAWAYLLYVAADMSSMAMNMVMPAVHSWTFAEFIAMFIMWSVMMVAMMLPSATPMILLFVRLNRNQELQKRSRNPVELFMGGYLLVWAVFSVFATLLNWGLHQGGALSSVMGRTTPVIAGFTLLAAGLFQWTPLKYACLTHCRSPIGFLMGHWREGRLGTVQMGIQHGLFCLGCCWLLMVLLFVLGVMNLVWIAVLTLFVLAEKILPAGHVVGRISGIGMIAWGVWLISLQGS